MLRQIVNAIGMLVVLTFLTGILYPLVMTGLAQGIFPFQASGSIINRNGVPIGSLLIGQNFSKPGYFHGRPSSAGENGYDATASSGSNLGPTSQKLLDTAKENVQKVRQEEGLTDSAKVPSDLVLASASGLDPDISPAAAYVQVDRIARERGLAAEEVRQLVERNIQGSSWGLLGEPRVNVLMLNMALDAVKQ